MRDLLNHKELDIGSFQYVNRHLNIGGHRGNRFKVLLRSVRPKTEVAESVEGLVTPALQSVETRGFINYFGLQRFNRTLSMPRVGLAMMQGDVVSGEGVVLEREDWGGGHSDVVGVEEFGEQY